MDDVMRKTILSKICGRKNNTSEIVILLCYYTFTVLSNTKKCHNHDMRRSAGEGSFNLEEKIGYLH